LRTAITHRRAPCRFHPPSGHLRKSTRPAAPSTPLRRAETPQPTPAYGSTAPYVPTRTLPFATRWRSPLTHHRTASHHPWVQAPKHSALDGHVAHKGRADSKRTLLHLAHRAPSHPIPPPHLHPPVAAVVDTVYHRERSRRQTLLHDARHPDANLLARRIRAA